MERHYNQQTNHPCTHPYTLPYTSNVHPDVLPSSNVSFGKPLNLDATTDHVPNHLRNVLIIQDFNLPGEVCQIMSNFQNTMASQYHFHIRNYPKCFMIFLTPLRNILIIQYDWTHGHILTRLTNHLGDCWFWFWNIEKMSVTIHDSDLYILSYQHPISYWGHREIIQSYRNEKGGKWQTNNSINSVWHTFDHT